MHGAQQHCKCMPTLCKKIHMDSCMRAYSTVQLCHGGYCELILSLARTSCRLLFTAHPTARPLAGNLLRDVVRSRNPSKSTLAHEAVATTVLHKHHPIIRVGAGLTQFVYRSHLRLAKQATRNRNAFSPFFARVFSYSSVDEGSNYHPMTRATGDVLRSRTAVLSVASSCHDLKFLCLSIEHGSPYDSILYFSQSLI